MSNKRWPTVISGWEIKVPFRHKNRLYRGQGLGWRFSSTRLLFNQTYSW